MFPGLVILVMGIKAQEALVRIGITVAAHSISVSANTRTEGAGCPAGDSERVECTGAAMGS